MNRAALIVFLLGESVRKDSTNVGTLIYVFPWSIRDSICLIIGSSTKSTDTGLVMQLAVENSVLALWCFFFNIILRLQKFIHGKDGWNSCILTIRSRQNLFTEHDSTVLIEDVSL